MVLRNVGMIIQVALPQPLRRIFDYTLPPALINKTILPGMRVKVPWGQQNMVGVVVNTTHCSDVPAEKLRPIHAILDAEVIISPALMQFCFWAADYYHHSIGETLSLALPPILRKQSAKTTGQKIERWFLTAQGQAIELSSLKRAPKQLHAMQILSQNPAGYSLIELKAQGINNDIIKKLQQENWITSITEHLPDLLSLPLSNADNTLNHAPLSLNAEQQNTVNIVREHLHHFMPIVLNGITGSGKTEVYLHLIYDVLQQGKQALILVPEIGLTPQTVQRFQQRFPNTLIAIFHSNLNDQARLKEWQAAQRGQARIIIGTRSALFTPLPELGIIIVDEAHDASFKQQDGLRYSARDLALKRGQLTQVPVILGSATHMLETLLHVKNQRFLSLSLTQRAGDAKPPSFQVIDMRKQTLREGIAAVTLKEIEKHLVAGNQVLLFINRRGFSPVLLCHDCGWTAVCERCDAKMTLHMDPYQLHCHHCDSITAATKICPACKGESMITVGVGTERVETYLQKVFPHYKTLRIDRDTTRLKNSLDKMLDEIHTGKPQILIGTQMLAKGHHFPNVTLVGILNVDQGLCSTDFRSLEQLAQLITQVAGRAGRAKKRGQVLLQTHYPDHPLMIKLLREGYLSFADAALKEREIAGLPPYTAMAVIRAEAEKPETSMQFLENIQQLTTQIALPELNIMGPMPAIMARRAGMFRSLLLIQAKDKITLQQSLKKLMTEIDRLKKPRKMRWHIDVDPSEIF